MYYEIIKNLLAHLCNGLCVIFSFYLPCDWLANFFADLWLKVQGAHCCTKFWAKINVDGEYAFRCRKCGRITTRQKLYYDAGLIKMVKHYLVNAFSLQMVRGHALVDIAPCTLEDVKTSLAANEFTLSIGHADTAAVVAALIGRRPEELYNRAHLEVKTDDVLYVAQVVGGRLPEGCVELPPGTRLECVRWQSSRQWNAPAVFVKTEF